MEKPARWHLALGMGVCILLILLIAWFHYKRERREAQEQMVAQLSAVADLKMLDIVTWRNERLGDAHFFSRAPFVARGAQALLSDPSSEAEQTAARAWMSLLASSWGYEQASLLKPDGTTLIAVPEGPLQSCSNSISFIADLMRDRKNIIQDLHRDKDDGKVHMNVWVPIYEPSGISAVDLAPPPVTKLIAALVLKIDPENFLFPVLQRWPAPISSGETLLVRREGDAVVFLNELRHKKGTALNLRLPLNSPDLPAAMALRNGPGVIRGRDYRGEPVLTVGRLIPDSPWMIGAKMDESEILMAIKDEVVLICLPTLALTLAIIGVFTWFIRLREMHHLESELKAQTALTEASGRIKGLVETAMDAIVSIDDQHRIVLFNPAAERMFGHREEDVIGSPLDRLLPQQFRETHEQQIANFSNHGETRRRFGALGNVFGLRANGEQFPVEVSISRETVGGQKFFSAIMRDITERVAAESQLRESETRLRHLGDNIPSGVIYQLVAEPDGRKLFAYISSSVKQLFGISAEEVMANPEPFWNLIHEDDRERLEAAQEDSMRKFQLFDLEFRQRNTNGDILWVNARSLPRKTTKASWFGTAW